MFWLDPKKSLSIIILGLPKKTPNFHFCLSDRMCIGLNWEIHVNFRSEIPKISENLSFLSSPSFPWIFQCRQFKVKVLLWCWLIVHRIPCEKIVAFYGCFFFGEGKLGLQVDLFEVQCSQFLRLFALFKASMFVSPSASSFGNTLRGFVCRRGTGRVIGRAICYSESYPPQKNTKILVNRISTQMVFLVTWFTTCKIYKEQVLRVMVAQKFSSATTVFFPLVVDG